MTSAAKGTSDRRRPGFTILEMVMVLSIFMLVTGGAVASLYFNSDKKRADDSMGEIEMLAKRARALAILQQRSYALEFSRNGVALMPYAEALLEVADREQMIADQAWRVEEARAAMEAGEIVIPGNAATSPVVRDAWPLEKDMQLLIRRWATGKWELLERGDRQVWRFDPEGICEPCGVRIEFESGSWTAALFHPLTAGITETESEIL